MKKNKFIKYYLSLTKPTIMIPVSLTGFTGYFLYKPALTTDILILTLGILLMASSASVINQIQEAATDGKMERTRNRPIPSGRIRAGGAVIFSGLLLLAGSFLVIMAGNVIAMVIGLITLVLYNCIYTPLKKVTAFAVIPGALTGALPPLMGWAAAGGGLIEKPILFMSFLFFMGQVPHFWLLVLKYGDDYTRAGLPSLQDHFNNAQISRLTFTWVITSVTAALFLCYFNIIRARMLIVILLAASVFIVWKFASLIRRSEKVADYRKFSVLLNSYFLLILILLLSDRIVSQVGLLP